MKIGYVPCSTSLELPGDRRRFVFYAQQRGIAFEIADPAKKYDVVILTECADLSIWLRYPHGKIVFDLIDSYLAIPTSDFKGTFRGLAKYLWRQTRYLHLDYQKLVSQLCEKAAAVICSTQEQAKDISAFCSNTHIVLDAHQMVLRGAIKADHTAHTPFRLVWEGLPHTLGALDLLDPILEKISQRYPLELHVVTDLVSHRFLGTHGKIQTQKRLSHLKNKIVLHEWSEPTWAETITRCDLAVIPISMADPFAAGKPENKLLLFWRLGMPVVASATPAYKRAMLLADVDMYCSKPDEWINKIIACIESQAYRKEMAIRGNAVALRNYSEENTLIAWDQVFHSILT